MRALQFRSLEQFVSELEKLGSSVLPPSEVSPVKGRNWSQPVPPRLWVIPSAARAALARWEQVEGPLPGRRRIRAGVFLLDFANCGFLERW